MSSNSSACPSPRTSVPFRVLGTSGNAVPSIDIKEVSSVRYGAAPVRTQATARKCRETPMGRTALAGLRRRLRWLGYADRCQAPARRRGATPLRRRHHASCALRRTVPNPTTRDVSGNAQRVRLTCGAHAGRTCDRRVLAAAPRPHRTQGLSCCRDLPPEDKGLCEASQSVDPSATLRSSRRAPRGVPAT